MPEDIDVDEWEFYEAIEKMSQGEAIKEIREKVELPPIVKRWVDVVSEFSLHNQYAATMAFYTTVGQLVKDHVRIPVGKLALDTRIHFCWIQTARSGKTTMFDFLSPVWDKAFTKINNHPLTLPKPRGPLNGVNEFTLSNPDAFTDQALLGTIKIDQQNPEWARGRDQDNVDFEGNPIPEFIDVPIAGALFGSGIIAFDEFEHSGIFKETQHKQDTVMMFQKFMNRLDSDTHLIKKRLTEWGRDLVVDCQRSLWATTLPPQGLEKVILTKGVFQRMWLYVREVPESLKMKMEEDYIDAVGVIDESSDDTDVFAEEFSDMLYDLYKWCKDRHEKTGDKRKVVIWSKDAQAALKVVWKGMRKYMDGFSDHIFEALNTFLMNTINNVCIAAGICAIAEKSPTIERRHVLQAKSLTDKSFDSITTWFSNKLKKNPKRIQEKGREAVIVKVFDNCTKKDGWVSKTQMVNTYMKMTQKGRATFYREWDNVEHLFDERRINGNRVQIRRKENEN